MVTDDGQQVVAGGLGGAVLGQEGLQVEGAQGERDVGGRSWWENMSSCLNLFK